MATYWLTFRIADQGDYDARYDRLHKTVFELANGGKWWVESTSFYLFDSPSTISEAAAKISGALDTDCDLALLGMTEVKSARAIGAVTDQDLFELVPFARRA